MHNQQINSSLLIKDVTPACEPLKNIVLINNSYNEKFKQCVVTLSVNRKSGVGNVTQFVTKFLKITVCEKIIFIRQ